MENPITFERSFQEDHARVGLLKCRGIVVETPVFMPVGTKASVKGMTTEDLQKMDYRLILGNTYHLHLRPGDELIAQFGGVAKFMSWPGLILTDSGGFQAFSLQKLNSMQEAGFLFRNHLDGQKILLSPEKSIQIQKNLHTDIAMCLDVCLASDAEEQALEKALDLNLQWAKRCLQENNGTLNLFGIVQGGRFERLRKRSVEDLSALPFQGMAIGGVSVGEGKQEIKRIVHYTTPLLPPEKPRYLMGVGEPTDMLYAIAQGVDCFDCVLPTRNGRNGEVWTSSGKIALKQKRYREDHRPIAENCPCYACRTYSRAYLRHLYLSKEILSAVLNTVHNLTFIALLMQDVRAAIRANQFAVFHQNFLQSYTQGAE